MKKNDRQVEDKGVTTSRRSDRKPLSPKYKNSIP